MLTRPNPQWRCSVITCMTEILEQSITNPDDDELWKLIGDNFKKVIPPIEPPKESGWTIDPFIDTPEEFKYASMDRNGFVYLYDTKPTSSDTYGGWSSSGQWHSIPNQEVPHTAFIGDWDDSLLVRGVNQNGWIRRT